MAVIPSYVIYTVLTLVAALIWLNWKRIENAIFGKPSERMVKVCPHCGSTKLKIPPKGMDLHMTLRDYCQMCGARGNFMSVEEDKVDEFRNTLKK